MNSQVFDGGWEWGAEISQFIGSEKRRALICKYIYIYFIIIIF